MTDFREKIEALLFEICKHPVRTPLSDTDILFRAAAVRASLPTERKASDDGLLDCAEESRPTGSMFNRGRTPMTDSREKIEALLEAGELAAGHLCSIAQHATDVGRKRHAQIRADELTAALAAVRAVGVDVTDDGEEPSE